MPECIYPSGGANDVVRSPNWGGLWAGTFGFLAIWSIFGFLGAALFASVERGHAASAGADVGMQIWVVVLTLISMYVAGRIAGGTVTSDNAWTTGTVVFGFSMIASLFMMALGEALRIGATSTGSAVSMFRSSMFVDMGWVAFVWDSLSPGRRGTSTRASGSSSRDRVPFSARRSGMCWTQRARHRAPIARTPPGPCARPRRIVQKELAACRITSSTTSG